jgi:hypothetical protein
MVNGYQAEPHSRFVPTIHRPILQFPTEGVQLDPRARTAQFGADSGLARPRENFGPLLGLRPSARLSCHSCSRR